MKILWRPHLPWRALDGQRERRLLEAWPDSGDELHVLTWQAARGFGTGLASLRWSTFREGRATVHSVPRMPNLLGRFTKNYARGLWLNERLFQYHTRRLVHRLGIDVLVYGIGHQVVGLPPFDVPVPRVFDYLDLITYPEIEGAYIRNSDLVICSSQVLVERVERFGKRAIYVPNGVAGATIAAGERERTRAALGLQGKRVVSLIGLTSSPTLFFVDALARVREQEKDLVFLVVGDGDQLRPIVERCNLLRLPVVATGRVPSAQVANYFAATDLGLYPGDANPYFDAACPIKVLEYSASRRPVVATDLDELRRMGFPNVRLAAPNPAGFADAIVQSLRAAPEYPDLRGFEWSALARSVREGVGGLVAEAANRRRPLKSLVQERNSL